MTIAVFSDIHGNIFSLEKALQIMQTLKPDKYLFLGDMAGYYYYQNECIELLNSLSNLVSLKGNHDHYFLESLRDHNQLKILDNKYGQAYSLLHKNITSSSYAYFYSLQEYEKNSYYEAYHASPDDYLEEYIYKDTKLSLNTKVPFIFLGHTHHPMNKRVEDTIIINPGSIGQPRDYNLGSFTLVDLKTKKIDNVRYEYNKKELKNKIIQLKDNKYILDVLERVK